MSTRSKLIAAVSALIALAALASLKVRIPSAIEGGSMQYSSSFRPELESHANIPAGMSLEGDAPHRGALMAER